MIKLFKVLFVNALTTLRVIGVFFLLPIFKRYGGVVAGELAIGCYFTDLVDGFLARKWHTSTFFGSIYDAIADKLFTCANLLVLLSITKYAIVPIVFELAIVILNSVKFSKDINIQSSKAGKLKTWIMSLTVIIAYLVSDISHATLFGKGIQNYILSISSSRLYLYLFIPLYIFEVITFISYLKFLKGYNPKEKVKIPALDIKLKPDTSFKNKWDNFCTLWLNNSFYEKYKDAAGLKQIRKALKENR